MRRDPFEMLLRCHRRLEEELQAVVIGPTRAQADVALGFIDRSLKRHEDDEEQSLFPQLQTAELQPLLSLLHEQHREQAALVEQLRGAVEPSAIEAAATALQVAYDRHILAEEKELFPAAQRLLDAAAIEALAAEMQARRGH
jgi:hemerythrin-like domain-containing protein